MDSDSRWEKAQNAETSHHTDIDRINLRTISHRFGMSADTLFEGKDILEVGCGSSGIIYGVNDQANDPGLLAGIDPILGKVNTPEISQEPVLEGIGEALPFEDDTFDVVASINVIDHTLDPQKVLKEIHRVLKSDGVFLLKVNTFQCLARSGICSTKLTRHTRITSHRVKSAAY